MALGGLKPKITPVLEPEDMRGIKCQSDDLVPLWGKKVVRTTPTNHNYVTF